MQLQHISIIFDEIQKQTDAHMAGIATIFEKLMAITPRKSAEASLTSQSSLAVCNPRPPKRSPLPSQAEAFFQYRIQEAASTKQTYSSALSRQPQVPLQLFRSQWRQRFRPQRQQHPLSSNATCSAAPHYDLSKHAFSFSTNGSNMEASSAIDISVELPDALTPDRLQTLIVSKTEASFEVGTEKNEVPKTGNELPGDHSPPSQNTLNRASSPLSTSICSSKPLNTNVQMRPPVNPNLKTNSAVDSIVNLHQILKPAKAQAPPNAYLLHHREPQQTPTHIQRTVKPQVLVYALVDASFQGDNYMEVGRKVDNKLFTILSPLEPQMSIYTKEDASSRTDKKLPSTLKLVESKLLPKLRDTSTLVSPQMVETKMEVVPDTSRPVKSKPKPSALPNALTLLPDASKPLGSYQFRITTKLFSRSPKALLARQQLSLYAFFNITKKARSSGPYAIGKLLSSASSQFKLGPLLLQDPVHRHNLVSRSFKIDPLLNKRTVKRGQG